jgi:hypothetical protein
MRTDADDAALAGRRRELLGEPGACVGVVGRVRGRLDGDAAGPGEAMAGPGGSDSL